jgi:sulfate transport system ATP-binding protein
VTQLQGALVRPHDIDLFTSAAPGAVAGQITRVTRIGFELRVDVAVADEVTQVTLTRSHFQELGIGEGDVVFLRPVGGAPTVRAGEPSQALIGG